MKKNLIKLTAAMMALFSFSSCGETEEFVSVNECTSDSISGDNRTIEDAINIANASLQLLDSPPSRGSGRSVNVKDIKIITKRKSRGSEDSLLYVVNFEANDGYAVIAAPKQCVGLLAITESGNYDPQKRSDNPGLEIFMESCLEYATVPKYPIDTTGLIPVDDHRIYRILRDTVSIKTIKPKLVVNWWQGQPFSKFFPNNYAGCTNIAEAMCMSYLEYPSKITCTFAERTLNEIDLNWAEFKKMKSISDISLLSSTTTAELQHFIKELACMNHSKIEDGGTSSSIDNANSSAKDLGLKVSAVTTYSVTAVDNLFSETNIIYMRGETSEVGHAWVVDGLKCYSIWEREVSKGALDLDWTLINDHGVKNYHLNHINWGWGGVDNGYFLGNVFDPYKGSEYDGSKVDYGMDLGNKVKFFTLSK